jgi:hypothetical protein
MKSRWTLGVPWTSFSAADDIECRLRLTHLSTHLYTTIGRYHPWHSYRLHDDNINVRRLNLSLASLKWFRWVEHVPCQYSRLSSDTSTIRIRSKGWVRNNIVKRLFSSRNRRQYLHLSNEICQPTIKPSVCSQFKTNLYRLNCTNYRSETPKVPNVVIQLLQPIGDSKLQHSKLQVLSRNTIFKYHFLAFGNTLWCLENLLYQSLNTQKRVLN